MIECARCGYKNDAAAKFCAACGAPMAASPAPAWNPGAAPQPPPNWGSPAPSSPAPSAAPQPNAPPAVPQQWGPPPNMQPPVPPNIPAAPPAWGSAPGGPPAAQVSPPVGYGAQPQWGMQPAPAAPGWGQPAPMHTPEAIPQRSSPPEPPLPMAAPTAASAVMAPLEPDQIPQNAAKTLAAFLVSFDTNPLGQFWPVYQGQNLAGRKGSGAELDLEIDHPTTSSRHAIVYAAARPGRLKVEDLGSTNGTYVNERRLETGERRLLEAGDTVRFGGFSVTIVPV